MPGRLVERDVTGPGPEPPGQLEERRKRVGVGDPRNNLAGGGCASPNSRNGVIKMYREGGEDTGR